MAVSVDASPEPNVVQVFLGPRSYDILIGTGILSAFARYAETWMERLTDGRAQKGRALVVTDRNLAGSHARTVLDSLKSGGWTCREAVLEPGEPSKSLETAAHLYDELVELEADRHTVVVAVGGGVVGDAAGFAAATYARGVPFVQVPTSLLAHVDSSVGGKVGINHPRAKNLIGAFHQPLGVCIDTATLDTLPDREYRSGLAEVVKYGVIMDEEFFDWLERNVAALNNRSSEALQYVIARSCRLKADVVEHDEFETKGLRASLNYGHTFAHAYEALVGYGELLHGEAVAIGMVDASRLSERLGRIGPDVTQRQKDLLEALHLPTRLPAEVRLSSDDVVATMKLDKKARAGRLRFVLPDRMGHVALVGDVPEETVRQVLAEASAR